MTTRAHACAGMQPLTLLPLVALIFYDVSGGPFGIEVRLSMLLSRSAAEWLLMRRQALRVATCLQSFVYTHAVS